MINHINEVNKYFLGVKLNTNYLKVNNVVSLSSILEELVPTININDLPLDIGNKNVGDDTF